ncbi:MAG: flavin reductase family protein [Pseudonocardiaceae bacterium]
MNAGRLIVVDVYGIFHELVADLDYPMFIVTVRAGERASEVRAGEVRAGEVRASEVRASEVRAGCLVGFACQTSIDPPRFLVCLSRKNHTCRVAERADLLAVHFVPRDADALAELFGGDSGDDVDKFARCDWRPGPEGVPILQECDNWFAGRIMDQLDLGDHVGFLLEPVEAHRAPGESLFDFHRAKRIEPGHPV